MIVETVQVHTCTQRIEGYIETKCTCRRWVTKQAAAELVLLGDASYVITAIKVVDIKVDCKFCQGMQPFVKSCFVCKNQGFEEQKHAVPVNGENIYMNSEKKTPRTPTIEASHIGRQFNEGKKGFALEAKERIRIYGILDKISLGELGAELRDAQTKELVLSGTPEPADDPATGQGRSHDYGRPI